MNAINAKTAWSRLGEGITGLAMIAQGLLAGLMGDYLIREKFSHPIQLLGVWLLSL